MHDTPNEMITEKIRIARSATGKKERSHDVCAIAEVASQPLQYIEWQRLCHRNSLCGRTPY
jgi:hypothetical protein